jgi:hypothetical protein
MERLPDDHEPTAADVADLRDRTEPVEDDGNSFWHWG